MPDCLPKLPVQKNFRYYMGDFFNRVNPKILTNSSAQFVFYRKLIALLLIKSAANQHRDFCYHKKIIFRITEKITLQPIPRKRKP